MRHVHLQRLRYKCMTARQPLSFSTPFFLRGCYYYSEFLLQADHASGSSQRGSSMGRLAGIWSGHSRSITPINSP